MKLQIKTKFLIIIVFLIVNVFCLRESFSEIITLKNNRVIIGKIIEFSSDYLRLDTEVGFPKIYYLKDILLIFDPEDNAEKNEFFKFILKFADNNELQNPIDDSSLNPSQIVLVSNNYMNQSSNYFIGSDQHQYRNNKEILDNFKNSKKSIAVIPEELNSKNNNHINAPVSLIDDDNSLSNESSKLIDDLHDKKKSIIDSKNILANNAVSGDFIINNRISNRMINKKDNNVIEKVSEKYEIKKAAKDSFCDFKKMINESVKESNVNKSKQKKMFDKNYLQVRVDNIIKILIYSIFKAINLELIFIVNHFIVFVKMFPIVYEFFCNFCKTTIAFYSNSNPLILKLILCGFILTYYVTFSFYLMTAAKHFDTKKYWMAWIPGLHLYLIVKMANKSRWFLILYFVPFVRFFNIAYLWSVISDSLLRTRVLGFLMLIPIVNLFTLRSIAKTNILEGSLCE